MIVPGDLLNLFKKPSFSLAWVLLILNLVIYFYTETNFKDWPSRELIAAFRDKNFAYSVEEMYKQTLDPVEVKQLPEPLPLTLILRDHRFWKRISIFPFVGDQVQIEKNRERLKKFQDEYTESAQYEWGLGPIHMSPWAWVTYQFTHASAVHLVGNMLILFLLVSLLEKSVSPFWIASVYLFGGFGGGVSYLVFEGSGSMAVVGASSSIFALLGFSVLVIREKNIPWTYCLFPVFVMTLFLPYNKWKESIFYKYGFGTIYMPAFLIFPILMMEDFVLVLMEPSGLSSSVAVSAHIGGAITGLLLGLLFHYEKALESYLLKTWKIDPRLLESDNE